MAYKYYFTFCFKMISSSILPIISVKTFSPIMKLFLLSLSENNFPLPCSYLFLNANALLNFSLFKMKDK